MANEKELTELYSGPGAESFRGFEDENGRVRATMRPGEIVTAAPWGPGWQSKTGESHSTVPRRSKSSMRTTRQQQNSRWGQHDVQLLDFRSPQARES